MQSNEADEEPGSSLEIIQYEPEKTQGRQTTEIRPRWKRLVDEICGKCSTEVHAGLFLRAIRSLRTGEPADEIIQILQRMAPEILSGRNQQIQAFHELVFASVCIVLEDLNYYPQEDITQCLRLLCGHEAAVTYLSDLKRGAKFANRIINGWAQAAGAGDGLLQISRATEVVLQGISASANHSHLCDID